MGAARLGRRGPAFSRPCFRPQLEVDATPGEEQSEIIIALAIAYSLAEERAGLADLNWRFGDAMARSDRSETFDMLTNDLDIGLITSITDELKGVDLIEGFLNSYPEDWVEASAAEPAPESGGTAGVAGASFDFFRLRSSRFGPGESCEGRRPERQLPP